MQQCNCTNTYRYPENGKHVCVICGEDWPEEVETKDANEVMCDMFKEHKKLTANHTKLSANQLIDFENLAKYLYVGEGHEVPF